jgi:hypothetical protein
MEPGCCGVVGPVPSTTLDKALPDVRSSVQSTYVNVWMSVKRQRGEQGAAGMGALNQVRQVRSVRRMHEVRGARVR